MTNEALLKAATEVGSKCLLADPRWDALAQGTLPSADRAELEALAQRSAEGQQLLDLYRPFDPAEKEALVERALARPSTPSRGSSLASVSRLRPRIAALVAAVSLAAAIALFVLFRPQDQGPIPVYVATLARGEQPLRGADASDEHVFGPGSEFELVLRPDVPVKGPVGARTFLERDGHVEVWDAPVAISNVGSVWIAGAYASVFRGLPPGPVDLVVIVGRSDRLPVDPVAAEKAMTAPAGNESWRLIRVRVRIADRGTR